MLHLAARLVVVAVGEVGHAGVAGIDQADLAGGQFLPGLRHDLEPGAGNGPAGRAGLAQRIGAGYVGDVAQLARRIAFMDHRAPPFDHALLGFGRAGRASAGDEPQRRQVIGAAHFGRQVQQAPEHGRHQVSVGQALLLNQPQALLGVEAWCDPQVGVVQRGLDGVTGRRRVVDRRADQGPHALLDAQCDAGGLRHAPRPAPVSPADAARPWPGLSCPRCKASRCPGVQWPPPAALLASRQISHASWRRRPASTVRAGRMLRRCARAARRRTSGAPASILRGWCRPDGCGRPGPWRRCRAGCGRPRRP